MRPSSSRTHGSAASASATVQWRTRCTLTPALRLRMGGQLEATPRYHAAVPPVAFFGPSGTFTEEALLTQPDLAAGSGSPTRPSRTSSPRSKAAPTTRGRADRELDRGLRLRHPRHARLRARPPDPAGGGPPDLAEPVREAGHDARRRHHRPLLPAHDRAVPRVAQQEAARRDDRRGELDRRSRAAGLRARSGPIRRRSATRWRPRSTA